MKKNISCVKYITCVNICLVTSQYTRRSSVKHAKQDCLTLFPTTCLTGLYLCTNNHAVCHTQNGLTLEAKIEKGKYWPSYEQMQARVQRMCRVWLLLNASTRLYDHYEISEDMRQYAYHQVVTEQFERKHLTDRPPYNVCNEIKLPDSLLLCGKWKKKNERVVLENTVNVKEISTDAPFRAKRNKLQSIFDETRVKVESRNKNIRDFYSK